MTTDAHRVAIDPTVEGPAPLPEVPQAGLVVASVSVEAADACGAHLLDFARRWQQEGRKIYLCDACFESPVLHIAAGVENGEGLSDALLYGTSLGRISHRIEPDIALASAGTVVGDPDGARAHGRWDTIVAGFQEAGALLIVTVPQGAPSSVLSAAAATHIDFGTSGVGAVTDAGASETGTDQDILATAVPLADEFAATDSAETAMYAADDFAAAGSDERGGHADPPRDADTGDRHARAEPSASQFDTSAGEVIREVEKRRSPLLVVILLIVVVVLALGFFGVVEIPGLTPTDVEAASDLLPNG